MPRGDRTGPAGMGSMTGRRVGFCAGYNAPGFITPGYCGAGYGRGCGRGYGRGMGYDRGAGRGISRMGYGPSNIIQTGKFDDKAVMTDQVRFLEEELEIARKQLAEIEKADGK